MKKFKEFAYIAAIASMAVAPVAMTSSAFADTVAGGGTLTPTSVAMTGSVVELGSCEIDVYIYRGGTYIPITGTTGGTLKMGSISSTQSNAGVVAGTGADKIYVEVLDCSPTGVTIGASIDFSVSGMSGTDITLEKTSNSASVPNLTTQIVADQEIGGGSLSKDGAATLGTPYIIGGTSGDETVYFTPKYNVTGDISSLSGNIRVKDNLPLGIGVSVS